MNFEDVVNQDAIRLSSEAFDGANWSLTDEVTSNLMKKISTSTIFLKDYLGVEVRRGIITGLSEAFILDKSKKDELVAADVNSEDLIVPFAVGDDIRKYEVRENGRFLILTKIGIEIEKYPAIFRHLQQYEKQLKKRWDKGNHWWELRACAYYDVFEKPKIIYPDIAKESRMTFVEEPLFV
ncbi:MAG: Eco57I restriction-modification methylase domain-containing protein, partial [Pyrinomonadaceae bacterium]